MMTVSDDGKTQNLEPLPGQRGYEAYFAAMKGANTKGDKLPEFADLLPTVQEAWAAVEHALGGA